MNEIVVTRLFDAPRELVFRMWSDPVHMSRWWGPHGYTTRVESMEFRTGGAYRYCMRASNGQEHWAHGTYLEVTPPERIVFTSVIEGVPDFAFPGTATFTEENGQTRLTVKQGAPQSKEHARGQFQGWTESLERLAESLALEGDSGDFSISRTFDAPRNLVYKAWTEADQLARWWGPKGFTMGVVKLDLKPGGLFHYSMKTPAGQEMWGRFVYREVTPPERLVFVNSFADEKANPIPNPWAAHWPLEVLNVLTFDERDGRTIVTLRGGPLNATEAQRNAFREAFPSMQQGFKGTFDQLEEFLAQR